MLSKLKAAMVPELSGKQPEEHWKEVSSIESPSQEVTDEQWKGYLSKDEYEVLRRKGTEAPHSSTYNGHMPKKGHYACRACGNALYSYESKFKAQCGWPAFGEFYEGSVGFHQDYSHQMRRTEIICNRCQSHLGHVFAERNHTATKTFNERHCVNGLSIRYVKAAPETERQLQTHLS